MTRDSLPPLNALRAFVAAAKHTSFTRAADDLGVTHGAVSKQVRVLEDHLGLPLFSRSVRQVSLTRHGRELLTEASPALERIAAAAGNLRQAASVRDAGGTVRINARPSFALRWLIPHLPAFIGSHPGIKPEVITSTADPADLRPGSYDVVIRRRDDGGRRAWPKTVSPRLFLRDRAKPVACPELLSRQPVRQVQDLMGHTLLHTATRDGDWGAWLARVKVAAFEPAGELRFEHLQFVLQAALDGLGIALAPVSLTVSDLAAGRLMTVLPRSPSLSLEPYCYGLEPEAGPASHAFGRWLESQNE